MTHEIETHYEVEFSDDGTNWKLYRENKNVKTAEANARRCAPYHTNVRILKYEKAPYQPFAVSVHQPA